MELRLAEKYDEASIYSVGDLQAQSDDFVNKSTQKGLKNAWRFNSVLGEGTISAFTNSPEFVRYQVSRSFRSLTRLSSWKSAPPPSFRAPFRFPKQLRFSLALSRPSSTFHPPPFSRSPINSSSTTQPPSPPRSSQTARPLL